MMFVRRVGGDVDVTAEVVEDRVFSELARQLRVFRSSPNASAIRSASSFVVRSTSTQSSCDRRNRRGRSARPSRCSTWSRSNRIALLTGHAFMRARQPILTAGRQQKAQQTRDHQHEQHCQQEFHVVRERRTTTNGYGRTGSGSLGCSTAGSPSAHLPSLNVKVLWVGA